MAIVKEFKKDNLTVKVMDSRDEMGRVAGEDAANALRALLAEKEEVNVIFAAAPSQNETLATLAAAEGIDWGRVNAFHMDEYIGLAPDAPQGFGNFLAAHFFDLVPLKSVNYLAPDANDPEATCARYTELLEKYPTDMIMMGIGENGHIAFNEPGDFLHAETHKTGLTESTIKANARFFSAGEAMPNAALTVGMGVIMRAKKILLIATGAKKKAAIKELLSGRISTACPASVLQMHPNATVICDEAAVEE